MHPIVEVFKTNVKQKAHAKMMVDHIHKAFCNYIANFDLEDCDNILRIKSTTGAIQPACLFKLLKQFGFGAEVLPDVPLPVNSQSMPCAAP